MNISRTRILTLALALLLTAACSARHLGQAQDEFSRAAAIENATHARGFDTTAADLAQSSAASYRMSLALVNLELKKNESKLRADKLYGTALMLKTYSLWRLSADSESGQGTTDEFTTVLNKAKGTDATDATVIIGERDRAMLAALPGLRDHDRGLQARDYATAEGFFDSAFTVVNQTVDDSKLVPAGSRIRIYLQLAMLSTCRAWQYSAYAFHADDLDKARTAAEVPRAKAKEVIKNLKVVAKGDKTLANWITNFEARMGLQQVVVQ